MTLGELIKIYREENGLSQRQFALKCEVSNGYISMLEKGANPKTGEPITPSVALLSSIASGMELTLGELFAKAEDLPSDPSFEGARRTGEVFVPKLRKVPLLGQTACGEPIFSPNLDDGYALIGEGFAADFALETKGDSMVGAGIHGGDIVYFKEQDMVDNGQIAAVFVDGEVTLKRVYYYREKNKLVLQPENPAYEPLVYTNEELDDIRIIGRAVAHLRRL